VYVWREHDTGSLSDEQRRLLLTLPASKADGLPGFQHYFDGAQYAFVDNDAPEVSARRIARLTYPSSSAPSAPSQACLTCPAP